MGYNKEQQKEYAHNWKSKNREKVKQYKKTDLEKNGEKRRAKRRENYKRWKEEGKTLKWELKRYGLTPEQYNEILTLQNNVCAICETPNWGITNSKVPLSRPIVDHDHKTDEVRGLICSNCNKGLGSFKDSIELLEKAINYLRRS